MLLKCTADGRPIKVNGVGQNQGNGARGMKMTTSTTPTMSARVHRKVIRAPHKRVHPGHPGKLAHPGKMLHAGKLQGKLSHQGKHAHQHAGKMAHHLGKFGKLAHYAHTHTLRPPEPCENSNDSGLGPDPVNRSPSDTSEEWDHPDPKRRRGKCESTLKIDCENANDAYPFPPPAPPSALDPAAPAPAPLDASATTTDHFTSAPILSTHIARAGCSVTSPSVSEPPVERFQDPYRSCGKLGGGKLANKYTGGGKLSGAGGKLGGKLSGKLGGKYGGKLAQALARRRALAAMAQSGPLGLAAPLTNRSRDGTVELQILCQPETQHRARYQTEGSRGAVKDNSGNGFPIVKLVGYDKPAVLQVFIGTDTGRVAPHMFYQACRVSGKNSTPCKERKEEGTVVIEIDLEPSKNWQVTCDCVGILKERNVDVEHRFGESLGPSASHVSRGKKKSTRCRMVFRTDIVSPAGTRETLQVCSTQIICTQPPGVPEVCRKSLVSSPAAGGLELYLLGKNFLKETRVVFRQRRDGRCVWEEEVLPDKEFLQQTHLVCCVPAYARADIAEAVCVQVFVVSGGRASEPHAFYYTPQPPGAPLHCTPHARAHAGVHGNAPLHMTGGGGGGGEWPLMGPPAPPARRDLMDDAAAAAHQALKTEVKDESSQHSLIDHSETSCSSDGPEKQPSPQAILPDDLQGVDLRLKSETIAMEPQNQVNFGYESIKLSPPTPAQSEPQSPLATFTQQLQAIQNQVQTDKMVETVTAAIFNSAEGAGQIYPPMMPQMGPMQTEMMPPMSQMQTEMKALENGIMMADGSIAAANDRRLMEFNPFNAMSKMEMDMETSRIERRLAQQSAHMDALVEDAMQATAAMLPADAAKLDELVNARVDDLAGGGAPGGVGVGVGAGEGEGPVLRSELAAVKTPPAAVKSMILSAAAEILTSDSAMNALVTSAINTASILSEPPPAPQEAEPLAAMSHAVSQAVTQAVSQAVSHAVSQAVSQEMAAPVQGLTDMSDQDLLSYINPSTFDQV